MPSRFAVSLYLAALVLDSTARGQEQPSGAAGKSPLAISDMMQIRHPYSQQLSPDGQHIAALIAEADFATNSYQFTLVVIDVATGQRRDVAKRNLNLHPCWSPDSKTIAFLQASNPPRICFYDLESGSVADESVAAPNGANLLAWSPRDDGVALLAPVRQRDRRRLTPVDTVFEDVGDDPHALFLCDRDEKKCALVPNVEGHVTSFAWSPDGRQIAYTTQPSAAVRDNDATDVWIVEVDDGACRPLVVRPGSDAAPAWSPDGAQIAFFSQGGSDDFFQSTSVCIVPASGGEPHSLAAETNASGAEINWKTASEPLWTADGRRLLLVGQRGVTRRLFTMDSTNGDVAPLTDADEVYRAPTLSSDRKTLSFIASSPHSPGEFYVTDLDRFEPRQLTDLNPALRDKALAEFRTVRWTSRDGKEIEGVLTLPADRAVVAPLPLITYLHGGPPGAFSRTFAPEITTLPQIGFCPVHVLAGRGYAVFCPNVRGSLGYGHQFVKEVIASWGEGDLDDVLSGIDALVERKIADPERFAITGYCYGAYLSLRAITRTDRFRAACLGGAFGDTSAVYGQTDRPDLFEAYFGGPPWQRREVYDRCSPMLDAHQIHTPTLLVHARQDKRIPWSQSKQLHTILRRQNTPVEMVTYPRGDHTVFESRMHAETMRLVVAWYDRYLRADKSAPQDNAAEEP